MSRKYKVNDNYSKKWSHSMAYILGLWWADGFINLEKNMFSITLHKKDKYLLSLILKEMMADYPLHKHGGNSFAFYIRSKTIIKDILRLGGKPNKSLDIGFPKIPKKYLSDFIRGLWDGDGSIRLAYNRKKSYISTYVSGSKKMIRRFYNVLKQNIPELKGSIYTRKNKTPNAKNFYTIVFRSNDSRRLRNFIYKNNDSLKMIRKYQIFLRAGEIYIKYKAFLSFKNAKSFVKNLNIKSVREWNQYSKSDKRPINIPSNPYEIYKNKGWISWPDFLGYA